MKVQEQDVISGAIDRITYHNPENGYAVLQITENDGFGLPQTVTGTVLNIKKGESVKCQGQWQSHHKYGIQFKASLIQSITPNDTDSIKKYLSSGIFKGLGPKHAESLIDAFGENVFDVIEKTPELLRSEIKLSESLCETICEEWKNQRATKDIILFLNSHGISANRANKIYETYGDNTIKIISENPYCLARDIKGIGFAFCDELAMSLGIEKDSIFRVLEGISHVLLEATFSGHCGLPKELLISKATELLKVDVELVKSSLSKKIDKGDLIHSHFNNKDLILLRHFYEYENKIADLMKSMQEEYLPWNQVDTGDVITKVQKQLNIELDANQRQALTNALTTKVMVITGGPGTGKTTLISSIINALSQNTDKLSIKLCAPTGRAAKRMTETIGMEAQTIHRMLGVNKINGGFVHNESNKLDCDYLVVDESSMIDVPLFCSLLKAIPETSGLLLVGDVDQLPSVGAGSVLSDIINSQTVITYRLDKIHRQKEDSNIVLSAHSVNKGVMPRIQYEKSEVTDFRFIESTPDELSDRLITLIEDKIRPCYDIKKDVQILSPMRKGNNGTIELNKNLQKALNPDEDNNKPFIKKNDEKYFEGDKVMQIENNYENNVFNGDVGTIYSIDNQEKIVEIEFDKKVVVYNYLDLNQITLAYAITIHKSQGSEYPVVIIPMTMQSYIMLQRNLIYTGITRGKKLVIIIGQKNALARGVKNNQIAKRYTRLKECLLANM